MGFFEKTVSSKTIFEGKVFDVCCQEVILDDNSKAYREVVLHHGGAGVLALDKYKNTFLVRQYRKGAECEMLEIPAGKLEKGENPYDAGMRELREETGYTTKALKSLGELLPTPAYCSEKIYLYLADELEFCGQELDEGEFLSVEKYPLDTLYEMVLNNEITDAKTAIAILKVKAIYG